MIGASILWQNLDGATAFAQGVLGRLAQIERLECLAIFMAAVAKELEFRHYALIDHDDLRTGRPGQVDLKDYPAAIVERLVGQGKYRRDPIIWGCLFADGAFMWSGDCQEFRVLAGG